MELLRMPRASENMVEGTVGQWLIEVGESANSGDPVVEIITEKAQFELECETGGIVRRHLASSRAIVPVNFIIAVLSEDDEKLDLDAIEAENKIILDAHLKATIGDVSFTSLCTAKKASSGRVSATPKARRLAKTSGIDLQDVKDSLSIDGIIEERHVQEFIESNS